jgi:hypothetical protein
LTTDSSYITKKNKIRLFYTNCNLTIVFNYFTKTNDLNETFTSAVKFNDYDQDAYDELMHLKRINNRKEKFGSNQNKSNQNFNKSPISNFRLNQRKLNFDNNDKSMLNDCIDRIDHIKEETDAIRRKYEMLKYSNELIPKQKKVPYAECYIKSI